MENQILELKPKHIISYLPYGLKCHCSGLVVDYYEEPTIPIEVTIVGVNDWFVEINQPDSTITDEYQYLDVFPLLRPLSDLTKEIDHDGEKLVPIEWFEVGDEEYYFHEFDFGNIKLIKNLKSISEHNCFYDINYLPYSVVQKLLEWHFDIFNLIGNQLASNINDYKQKEENGN
jgi:hypothetical protein